MAISVVACSAIALALYVFEEPVYESDTQFFVSTSAGGGDLGSAYEGALFAQQRVASYAQIVSSTELLGAVAAEIELPGGAPALEDKLRAEIPADTVLIDITARDGSAARAKAIADAVVVQLPRFIGALESPRDPSSSAVRASVTRRPELPLSAVSPDLKWYLALGLLGGLALGIGAVAVAAGFDDRVRSVEAVERILGVPVLGSVAEDGSAGAALVLLDEPLSGRAEDYRRMRTHLDARWGSRTISAVLVTSVGPHDGKSAIAANLGIVLAHGGRRVALVDGDIRARALSELLRLHSGPGLADVLAGEVTPEAALAWSSQARLGVMGAGAQRPEAGAGAGCAGLAPVIDALREHADVVIVDAPSLAEGVDALQLAATGIATLLVTRLHSTRAAQLEHAARAIGPESGHVVGAIVNRRRPRRVIPMARRAVSALPAARSPAAGAAPRADAACR